MNTNIRWIVVALMSISLVGCCLRKTCDTDFDPCDPSPLNPSYDTLLTIEEPCVEDCESDLELHHGAPMTMEDFASVAYTNVSLEQCIEEALRNSKVMRDLGGTVLRSPESLLTVNDPAIAYTDPRFGEEAALSQFDAQLNASAYFDKGDRANNNLFLGNLGIFQQDLFNYEIGVSKQTAHGSLFSLKNLIVDDLNNQTGNRFGSPSRSYDAIIEGQWRQPLLQGAGLRFNRIAGPSRIPGEINGVLVARTNTDIALAQFERSVRDLVADVENAYWDLYFAYRDLSAKIDARDEALGAYQHALAVKESGKESIEPVLQAQEQYFRFRQEVIDALNGRIADGTRTNNGTPAGTFRAIGGVRVAERRLRLIIGWPINGGELLRTADEPVDAPVTFDWDVSVADAMQLRPELRQQRWVVKQRELELCANKNFLKPRLDMVSTYRFRGFGAGLTGGDNPFDPTLNNTNSNALADLLTGNWQEWQLGFEFNLPIGQRLSHAAVRNSELELARERAILREQKREIVFGLSNSVNEVMRAYEAKSAAYNRYMSALQLTRTLSQGFKDGEVSADVVLEAHRRQADANIQYHLSRVDYALSIRNVHFEKGTLLRYCNVGMTESEWNPKAYMDANERRALRTRKLNYAKRDLVISAGPADVGNAGNAMQPIPAGMPIESESQSLQPRFDTPVPIVTPKYPTDDATVPIIRPTYPGDTNLGMLMPRETEEAFSKNMELNLDMKTADAIPPIITGDGSELLPASLELPPMDDEDPPIVSGGVDALVPMLHAAPVTTESTALPLESHPVSSDEGEVTPLPLPFETSQLPEDSQQKSEG